MYANSRSAAHPRSTFQTAGGTIMKFRHPFLSGQISGASPVDEIDVSRSVRLNETFLDANPSQDSSFQEVLVDGSVITITNHLMAGQLALPVIRTTGLVGTGDFIAAAHLVIASKDDIGGTFTHIESIGGKRLVTVFYGVSFKNVPHLKKAGNAVVPYSIVMLYAGWVQGVGGDSVLNEKTIWAVGNKYGLKGVYKPYGIQSTENQSDFFGGAPLGLVNGEGAGANAVDESTGDIAGQVPTTVPAGGYPKVTPSAANPNPTWQV
jgi:hypothetical protein